MAHRRKQACGLRVRYRLGCGAQWSSQCLSEVDHAPSTGFGTLMQDFRADHYQGKRVRFSAFVKTEAAQDWAGLWMRVDKEPTDKRHHHLAEIRCSTRRSARCNWYILRRPAEWVRHGLAQRCEVRDRRSECSHNGCRHVSRAQRARKS